MPDWMEMLGEATQSEFPWEAGDDLAAIRLACMWMTSRLDARASFPFSLYYWQRSVLLIVAERLCHCVSV